MYYVRVVEVLECGDGDLECTVFYTFYWVWVSDVMNNQKKTIGTELLYIMLMSGNFKFIQLIYVVSIQFQLHYINMMHWMTWAEAYMNLLTDNLFSSTIKRLFRRFRVSPVNKYRSTAVESQS